MKKDPSCCFCDEDFKENLDEMVDEVKGYGPEQHKKKEKEVEAAFGNDDKKKKKATK